MTNTAVKQAHVKLGTEEKTAPAGETIVSVLKTELGIAEDAVLWFVHGNKRRPLGNEETIDVESGAHFEAIGGGGVS